MYSFCGLCTQTVVVRQPRTVGRGIAPQSPFAPRKYASSSSELRSTRGRFLKRLMPRDSPQEAEGCRWWVSQHQPNLLRATFAEGKATEGRPGVSVKLRFLWLNEKLEKLHRDFGRSVRRHESSPQSPNGCELFLNQEENSAGNAPVSTTNEIGWIARALFVAGPRRFAGWVSNSMFGCRGRSRDETR